MGHEPPGPATVTDLPAHRIRRKPVLDGLINHGGEGRIRAARFPAVKTLEELDITHLRGLTRQQLAHLGTLDFIAGKENAVFLGPTVIAGLVLKKMCCCRSGCSCDRCDVVGICVESRFGVGRRT
ncbi:ATP-binding protein [Actinacidiphila soli]|uniref:ATP-binding protein n=1 Tax=Actinacidiphila soli TaxID=2487275 RepID=UPI002AFEF123|nr:ATP-binding protein [Actinacidiphila soli]